ncbi:hypothetical protein MCEGE14_02097 [Burkholderiaceae bacterium]
MDWLRTLAYAVVDAGDGTFGTKQMGLATKYRRADQFYVYPKPI